MPFKNVAYVDNILAWDTVNGVGITGDAANITLRGVGDGVEFTPSSPSITQIDATNLKGVYSFALTAGENNYSSVLIGGISSTSGVIIMPIRWTNESDAKVVAGVTLRKNVAFTAFPFVMFNAAGNPTAGLVVTATRSLDGAAFAACANAVTEVANGVYKINIAATDINANSVVFRFTAPGAKDTDIVVISQP